MLFVRLFPITPCSGTKHGHRVQQQRLPLLPLTCPARAVGHHFPELLSLQTPHRPRLLVLQLDRPGLQIDRPESEIGMLACGPIDHRPITARNRVSAHTLKYSGVGPRERLRDRPPIVPEPTPVGRFSREQMQSSLLFGTDEEPPDCLPAWPTMAERIGPCVAQPEQDEGSNDGRDPTKCYRTHVSRPPPTASEGPGRTSTIPSPTGGHRQPGESRVPPVGCRWRWRARPRRGCATNRPVASRSRCCRLPAPWASSPESCRPAAALVRREPPAEEAVPVGRSGRDGTPRICGVRVPPIACDLRSHCVRGTEPPP